MRLWKSLGRNKLFIYGSSCFLTIITLLLIIPVIAETDPLTMSFDKILSPPSREAIFGTDDLGRDLFSRVIHGGRVSIQVGLQVMLLTTLFGSIIGLVSGFNKKLDSVLMFFNDTLMAFPSLLLALSVMAVLGNKVINVVIALTITYTPRTVRVVRANVLSIREMDYVASARALGLPTWRILLRHVFPNVVPALIVQETFLFAYAILGEAGLSFVGVGIQPPLPSWGNILGDARTLIRAAPWMIYFTGIALTMVVLSLNILGDGLREALDPKRKELG